MFLARLIFRLALTCSAYCAVAPGAQFAARGSAHSGLSFVTLEELTALSAPPSQSEARININTAGSTDLTRLPGIGPALAARIIEHRRKHGSFKRPQEIIVVRGMSAKRYRQLAHLIRI